MNQDCYAAKTIEEGFWSIEEGGVRCFLIEGQERAMLVDTGFGGGDLKAFVRKLTDQEVFVIHTHADPDHTGGDPLFSSAFLHPSEFDRFAQKNQGKAVALKPIWEGDKLELGNRTFEVLLLPGHTPGSIGLLDRKNRLLIGGDSVQKGPIFMFGPGRNLQAYRASLIRLKQMDAFDRILSSHGEMTLNPGILDQLLLAAGELSDGLLEGKKPDRDLPCQLYESHGVSFYYSPQ